MVKQEKTQVTSEKKGVFHKITTLHAINHITNQKGSRRLVWILMLVINSAFVVSFIVLIKARYDDNQILTRINPNCRVNQVPFPAVSICNLNMMSERESKNIAKLLAYHNKSQEEIYSFFHDLPNLKTYEPVAAVESHTHSMNILKQHYFTVDTVMDEIHQGCTELLLYCSFNRKKRNCDDIFNLIKTYEGFCCTFNYDALNDGSEDPLLSRDTDFEFYVDGSSEANSIITTSQSGRFSGLSVVFDVEPNDYASWNPIPFYGAQVLISDPNDYPETTVVYKYVSPGEMLTLKVDPNVFLSEPDIRKVPPEHRGCWFHDEALLEHTHRYSFETCHTECKMWRYVDECGCLPYKYPREKGIRTCEFKDLSCLNNITVYSPKFSCKPACYMECIDKKYIVKSDHSPFLSESYPEEVTQDRNVSELLGLQVFFTTPNCKCFKMLLLIDLNNFIANYGGIFSLWFGGSIITLFELIYLFVMFTLRRMSIFLINLRKERA